MKKSNSLKITQSVTKCRLRDQAVRYLALILYQVIDYCPFAHFKQGKRIKALINKGQSLCAAETWVNTHQITLELATGWSIGGKDVTDDRLARVVEQFGLQEKACQGIEQKLGQHLKRPDLLQYRQMLGTLDTAGIPLVSETLAGRCSYSPWP